MLRKIFNNKLVKARYSCSGLCTVSKILQLFTICSKWGGCLVTIVILYINNPRHYPKRRAIVLQRRQPGVLLYNGAGLVDGYIVYNQCSMYKV